MKTLKYLVTIYLLLLFQKSFSQLFPFPPGVTNVPDNAVHFTSWSDQNKYWYYRYRLVNGFLIRGEENPLQCNKSTATGYSIPAGNSLFTDDSGTNIDLDWGDGTSYLGWYISVLATEYKLLSDNGQPTEVTKRELYFAMKAYERLDIKAETLFYPFLPNADCSMNFLDGLFVRDDVSQKLLEDYPGFTNKFKTDDNNLIFRSDYHKYQDEEPTDEFDITKRDKSNIYPTQDQISDLFMGFALVKKCLGNETYQGYNFTEQAKNYTRVIVKRLEDDGWLGKFANPERQIYTNGHNIKDEFNAYGIARAAEEITGEHHTRNLEVIAEPKWNLLADATIGSTIMNATYYGLSASVPFQGKMEEIVNLGPMDWTTALQQTLAAIGHSWELGIKPVEVNYTKKVFNLWCMCEEEVTIGKCVIYKVQIPGVTVPIPECHLFPFTELPNRPTIKINVTEHQLSLYGEMFGQEIYALLHEYLHEQRTGIPSTSYANIVKSAPCDGPQHKPYTHPELEGENGWRGINRWERPLSGDGTIDADSKKLGRIVEGTGSYNGLDYMLLYNLYLLNRGKSDTDYRNLLSITSSQNITSAGSYWSYETLELSGVVQSNESTSSASVEISANNSIILKPGFKIEPGANVSITLETLTACSTDLGEDASLRKASSSSENKSKEFTKQEILNDLAKEIQLKLDSTVAAFNQNTSNTTTYTTLEEYLAQGNNSAELKNEQATIFPNPIDDFFIVEVQLKSKQKIEIVMSDVYNNVRVTLFNGNLNAGANKLKFDTKKFSAGVFNIEIRGTEFKDIKRLVKLK